VVPPALVWQWQSEIQKITGDTLVYEFFNHKTATFERKSTKSGPADIVVTTYQALQPSKKKKNTSAQILKERSWGRVVLDEMQEIRSSTSSIAKNCEELDCNRRWMLSGTPLFEGIKDFRGELCFLRLEPFAASSEDGFFDFAIKDPWEIQSRVAIENLRILSLLLLRRSKNMTHIESGQPILFLKTLEVYFEPVEQPICERQLYYYLEHLVRATLDKVGDIDVTNKRSLLRLLRDACVSPFLLTGGLGCLHQLKKLNDLIVNLYGKKYASLPPSTELSCDEALEYLSQIDDIARVDEQFQTSQSFGAGGGTASRNRALETPQERHDNAKKEAVQAGRQIKDMRSKRARGVRT
jgi:SNF2 family DNA or RNA helicase